MAGHTCVLEAKKTVKLFPNIATFSITLTHSVSYIPAGLVKMKYINILCCPLFLFLSLSLSLSLSLPEEDSQCISNSVCQYFSLFHYSNPWLCCWFQLWVFVWPWVLALDSSAVGAHNTTAQPSHLWDSQNDHLWEYQNDHIQWDPALCSSNIT